MDIQNPTWLRHQADAVLAQANPVSTTLYTVLATTPNVRIISMVASVEWTVQPTPLEIVVTIDDVPMTFTQANPVTATNYAAFITEAATAAAQLLGVVDANTPFRAFLLEGRSVLIQARTTGGTVQNLNARVKYARRY